MNILPIYMHDTSVHQEVQAHFLLQRHQQRRHQPQRHQALQHQLPHHLQRQPRQPGSPSTCLPTAWTLTMASPSSLPGYLCPMLSLKCVEFVDLSRLRRTRPTFVSLPAPTTSKTLLLLPTPGMPSLRFLHTPLQTLSSYLVECLVVL